MKVNLSHLEEHKLITIQQFFKKIIRSHMIIKVTLDIKEIKTKDTLRKESRDMMNTLEKC